MNIKGYEFRSGAKPMICVPVMGQTVSEVLAEAERVIAGGAQMIEWRVDFLERWSDEREVLGCLDKLESLCKSAVLLVTMRTADQGGRAAISGKQLEDFYISIAEALRADLIDVEFMGVEKPNRLFKRLHEMGARIIASHHDFSETPEPKLMETVLEKMALAGADIAKIAVMPQSKADVLSLLSVTASFCEKYPEVPVVSMSMGSLGMISRLSGEVFGSCMTFGTMGAASAPGQVSVSELENVLEIIHSNLRNAIT